MSRPVVSIGTYFFLNRKIMKKSYAGKLMFVFFLCFAAFWAGCSKKPSLPEEKPEEVVKKFYAYIKEGGTTTLGEAFRLTKKSNLFEDEFKKIVSDYPKEMEVKVLGSKIDEEKNIATVAIEYKTPSSFGGFMVANTDINLVVDPETNSWKIDFTGDTRDENPNSYSKTN